MLSVEIFCGLQKILPVLDGMRRHTETAESQSSYTNFAFLPYGEWASEFEKGETPLIIAVKLVQLVGVGKTHGLS